MLGTAQKFHIQRRSLASSLVSNWRMSLVYLRSSFKKNFQYLELEIFLPTLDFE